MEDALKSLKEFIWDIIGYLIPGFLLIIVFNFILVPDLRVDNHFIIDWQIFQSYLIVVISYVLGYVIYSLTILKITVQDLLITSVVKFNTLISGTWFKFFVNNKLTVYLVDYLSTKHSEYWQKSFLSSSTYKSAKDFLKEKNYTEVDNMKLNEIRNILMSRNPEMDQKVYTFMFRSSLFDHISTISLIVCLAALIQFFFPQVVFLKTTPIFKVFYVVLIAIIPLLGNSKRVFYSIAKRLPISNLK